MAGIYIHIPFCRTRCSYCDFFSTTNETLTDEYVEAICFELAQRKGYLMEKEVVTIYFGGGTPSQLKISHFESVFRAIFDNYKVDPSAEITVEVNPDDITEDYTKELQLLPFNRISMGVQSFDNGDLKRINRRHDAQQALDAVYRCREFGFENISIDLIYGLPEQTLEKWQRNVEIACSLQVEHISAYHLIYEKGTKLYQQLRRGVVSETDEELSVAMFRHLKKRLEEEGFEHYEISNFARNRLYSKHNTAYWTGELYLGVGASAHSFNGQDRSWNESNMKNYLSQARKRLFIPTYEKSTLESRYNDYIIVSLRTMWGVELIDLRKRFGNSLADYFKNEATRFVQNGWMKEHDGRVVITDDGQFVSDTILTALIALDN